MQGQVVLDGEDFYKFECFKCGTPINAEEEMEQACAEPFNGIIIECANEECDAEYDCNLRFVISPV